MRKIHRRKSNIISCLWESHIHERVRDPLTHERSKDKGKMRFTCHPELRTGIGAWGFQGQEGHSQDNKKNRCIRCLPCHIDGATQIKFLSGNNSFSGKNPQSKFFQIVKKKVIANFLSSQGLQCLQLKITHMPKWYILGRPVVNPTAS